MRFQILNFRFQILSSAAALVLVSSFAMAQTTAPSTQPVLEVEPPTTAPAEIASTQPATQQSSLPSTQPTTFPSTQPSTRLATTMPTTQPTTQPAGGMRAGNESSRDSRNDRGRGRNDRSVRVTALPSEYAILETRSIFMRGRTPTPSTTQASTQPTVRESSTPTAPTRREDQLVFCGVTDADGVRVAYIEDRSANKILALKAGDLVASGKVGAITLDSLDYEVAGHNSRIMIGQTFAGVSSTPGSAVPASSGGAASTSGLPAGSGDILERMRQRRAQEMGQK